MVPTDLIRIRSWLKKHAIEMAHWTQTRGRTRPEWLAEAERLSLRAPSNLPLATPGPSAVIGVGLELNQPGRYHLYASSVDGRISYHRTMQHVISWVSSPSDHFKSRTPRGTPTSTSRDGIESICFNVLPSLSSEYEVHCTWLRLIQLPAKLGLDGKTLVKLEADDLDSIQSALHSVETTMTLPTSVSSIHAVLKQKDLDGQAAARLTLTGAIRFSVVLLRRVHMLI